jgi:hypothetical protein
MCTDISEESVASIFKIEMFSTLKMEAARSSEMLVSIYQTTLQQSHKIAMRISKLALQVEFRAF